MEKQKNISIWKKLSKEEVKFPRVDSNLKVKTVIIGAGMTGMVSGMLLHEQDSDFIIVEALDIGSGTTGDSGGHLSVFPDRWYHKIIEKFGVQEARDVANARIAAIHTIERICKQYKFSCQFEKIPSVLFSEIEEDSLLIEAEEKALKDVGVDFTTENNLSFPVPTKRMIRFDGDAQFVPMSFCQEAARFLKENGRRIFCNSQVTDLKKLGWASYSLRINGFEVIAENVIVASHIPLFIPEIQKEIVAHRTYAVAYKIDLNDEQITNGLFWSAANPYRYIRTITEKDHRILLVGGNDHRTGTETKTERFFEELHDFVELHFKNAHPYNQWDVYKRQYYN